MSIAGLHRKGSANSKDDKERTTTRGNILETVKLSWEKPVRNSSNIVTTLSEKFKRLRYDLKQWSKGLSNMKMMIENCNKVIVYLDVVEEFRALFNPKWNLRKLVKRQLSRLLVQQTQYWKQRNTINRIKYGDECTKYFHSMATISYRRNLIAQVQDDYGVFLIHHEDKANHLGCSFKNRMGIFEDVSMEFDLSALVNNFPDDLSCLVSPFSVPEIDHLIKIMPADKAPRPDGFNGVFIKKCWLIIKEDIYRFFKDFYDSKVNLSPINNSFIVLVPKISNPITALDFRPISCLAAVSRC
jgi:hypothetical protein